MSSEYRVVSSEYRVLSRVEGKESGFRSLESIWTEDGGSGGHGRGGTGRARPYRTK